MPSAFRYNWTKNLLFQQNAARCTNDSYADAALWRMVRRPKSGLGRSSRARSCCKREAVRHQRYQYGLTAVIRQFCSISLKSLSSSSTLIYVFENTKVLFLWRKLLSGKRECNLKAHFPVQNPQNAPIRAIMCLLKAA